MALIFVGLISIPLCLTENPRNLPDVTPNAHLSGFILMFPPSIKDLLQVVSPPFCFDDEIIDIAFDNVVKEPLL